ncbi:uncharacterized protein LOC136019610 isoform X2 [Lathamus discolor]
MAPQRMVVTLALLLGGCCTSAYPAYPESNRAQALKPTDFSLADGAGGFMAESKPAAGLRPSKSLNQALPAPWEGVSHDQRAARGNGEKRALQEDVPGPLGHSTRVMGLLCHSRVKTLMHSSGRWWPWAISRARGLPRQTRLLHSPTRELASGNTVSPSEGLRRSSASHILPPRSQRLPSTPDPAGLIALSCERALVPCGESGEGLQQRRVLCGRGRVL